MTLIDSSDDVVYEIAINDHPLVVGEDDDRTDEELVAEVAGRTAVADDLTFPGWTVFVSDPPDMERLRYVNTTTRINVLAPYETERLFDAVADRIEIDGYDMENAAMSCPGPTHPEDFDGEIHLDLTD